MLSALTPLAGAGQNLAFAVTYSTPGSSKGSEVKLVDLHTGETVMSVFEKDQFFQINDARTSHLLRNRDMLLPADSLLQPMATSVAAAAYDEKNNYLFYAPLGINQLRYVEISGNKTAVFNYVMGQDFGAVKGVFDQPNQITRMIITPDGNGYALSNDANHFIKFTTGKNVQITDMGALIDNPLNVPVSIHSSCSSAGGDMVSAGNGNLLLVTSFNHVFSIDVPSQMATYKGAITGLPAGFTSNGAAVDDEGQLIVDCATCVPGTPGNAYYKVDINSLAATPVTGIGYYGSVTLAADLANNNVLGQPARMNGPLINPKLATVPGTAPGRIFRIYPNPVKDDYVDMTFTNFAKGNYKLQIQDMRGRTIINNLSITINKDIQVERIDLKESFMAQGEFIVHLIDQSNVIVETRQLILIKGW